MRSDPASLCVDLHADALSEPEGTPATTSPPLADVILSRAQRARSRLDWQERLARNARTSTARPVTIRVFGVPAAFAASLGLATA